VTNATRRKRATEYITMYVVSCRFTALLKHVLQQLSTACSL